MSAGSWYRQPVQEQYLGAVMKIWEQSRCSFSRIESALDLIESGGLGRCGVRMEAWPLGQPGADFGMLVGALVVGAQMHVQALMGLAPRTGLGCRGGSSRGSRFSRRPEPLTSAAVDFQGLGFVSSRRRAAPSPCRACSGTSRRCP